MEVSTVKEMNDPDCSDTEHVPIETHNKLLNAVYQIYKKQRINKPLRREPTSQISEFNLTHKTDDSSKKLVNVKDLVSALNKRATHHEIRQKVHNFQRKSKPLPKPLEKIYADKIRRKIGYASVRKQLARWEAVVERNRAAEQLKFPLQDNTKISIRETNDFLKTFKEPTELEKEVAAVLQTSEIAQEEKETEEALFPLSLEEIIERRKLIAHMRARESYKMAKAFRQNKIKSKKYHRILKREKIKKALKDFEILQVKDPQAALEKLERIERARAEERFTLRHRNTGKWAKSQAIRAKYDSEARAQLAEQLAKSRELTKKIQSSINTSSDEEDSVSEEDEQATNVCVKENSQVDPSNPWSNFDKQGSEITSFLEGYKKYQSENSNDKEGNEITIDNSKLPKLDSNEEPMNSSLIKQSSNKTVDTINDGAHVFSKKTINDKETESNVEAEEDIKHEIQSDSKDEISQESCNLSSGNDDDKGASIDLSVPEDILDTKASDSLTATKESFENHQTSNVDESNDSHSVLTVDKNQQPNLKTSINLKNNNKIENISSSDVEENRSDKRKNKFSDLSSMGKSKKVKNSPKSKTLENLSSNLNKNNVKGTVVSKNKKLLKKRSEVKTQSGVWAVSTSEDNDKEGISQQENITIDKMFDKAENVLKETLDNHINQLKEDINKTDKSETQNLKKSKYQYDLSFKTKNRKPNSDSTLIEVASEGVSGGENDFKSILKANDSYDKANTSEPVSDVDPNPIFPVKPSKLNSGGIDFVEEQEEDVENEQLGQNRPLNLKDAFADDDVAEEFRREKEEEIENSKPKEVDLSLPGWGSWGGHNVNPKKNSRKRKTRRLIVKFPEILRKDEKKDYVIINEELNPALKNHMVHDLPFPFTSVKDYEASIRAPIGNNWVPQSAFMKLIRPAVITKLGAIIEPMKDSELVNNKNIRFRKKK